MQPSVSQLRIESNRQTKKGMEQINLILFIVTLLVYIWSIASLTQLLHNNYRGRSGESVF